MAGIFETIKKVCDYKTSVLLSGESGTGKELIAKRSTRRSELGSVTKMGALEAVLHRFFAICLTTRLNRFCPRSIEPWSNQRPAGSCSLTGSVLKGFDC